MSMKNSNDTIENRTRDLPACSAVPQLTALQRFWDKTPCNLIGNKVFDNHTAFIFREEVITVCSETSVAISRKIRCHFLEDHDIYFHDNRKHNPHIRVKVIHFDMSEIYSISQKRFAPIFNAEKLCYCERGKIRFVE